MKNNNLLAKPDESLIRHTENVLKVLKSIKDNYENIPEICGVDKFWEHLFYSIFLHDFGKAASGFQNMLNNNESWNYRHEILSASFIPSLNNIYTPSIVKAIGLCIITHHKDLNELDRYDTFSNVNMESYLEKLEELKPNINELNSYFDLIPEFSEKYLGYKLISPKKLEFDELKNPFENIIYDYQEYNENYNNIQYGIFLKGFINACDYLASAGQYEILTGLETKKLFNFDNLQKTQKFASKTIGDAFLIAPTGTGKTEASLLWADNNQNQNFSKRIFYMLPYTASINAMYERLRKPVLNKELIGLFHGKASYYIYKTLNNNSRKNIKEVQSLTKKIYRPLKILTPFQVIKYLFSVKGFEMGLSELANSLIIIDEVHAYDARTTCLLLETLKYLKENFKTNVFIMSATLPSFLKNLFQKELGIINFIQLDNNELDSFTRHRVNVIEGCVEDYCDEIYRDIKNGKKVLIVCNTVDKSQMIFKYFKDREIENSSLLHGKFTLKDREEIEKKLNNLNLLVGTQAIEVSLDIDYDVLYTEPAPFDALIQRFGRINRRGWSENIIKTVNIFSYGSENDKFIYNQNIVKKTLNHLKKVDLLKESIIQEILDDIYKDGYDEKDFKIFNDVKTSFNNILNLLIPFVNKAKNDFYTLFNSFEVVPLKYREIYLEKIDNKEFYEAMGYTLNITAGQFYKQKKKGNINKYGNTFFIDVYYDSELGLLLSDDID